MKAELVSRPAIRPMVDPFARHVTYVSVSVTDRCDFRCVYCMSEHMTFLPKTDLLTLEEYLTLPIEPQGTGRNVH